MITPFRTSANSMPSRRSSEAAAARFWASSMVIAVWLGLLVMGRAEAVEIPASSDLPPAIAEAHAELVKQCKTLFKDREVLGARARRHTSRCRAVEEGSATEASCTQALATLTLVINTHIQASTQFNDNLRTVINHEARLKPAPVNDTSEVDAQNVPSGLPKALDKAIAAAYSDSPPGVITRVRRGFEAAMGRDWNAAKALFEDALKYDSDNASLKRLLVALAGSSQLTDKQPATVDARNEPAALGGTFDLTGALAAVPSHTRPVSAVTQKHIQLPGKDYMHLLFPGLQAMDDSQALGFLFGLDAQPPSSRSGKVP